jgi:hypothetical protein
MTPLARLAGFAAVLAVVFAGAWAVGGVADVDRSSEEETPEPEHGEVHGSGTAAPQPVRGLAVSAGGLTLEPARTSAPAGRRFELAFRIAGSDGRTVRDFDVEHTKRMHVIVVRRDLTAFQHVHPEQRADGSWSVPITLDEPGTYRVFADFSVDGTARTLATDLTVDGAAGAKPLPAPATDVEVDGLRVRLERGASTAGAASELAFAVTRDGAPVKVDDFLGAKGHLVALREGDLAFLHVHPEEDRLGFEATFPTAGRYRLFLQFQAEGRLHTAAFTQEVGR